MIEILSTIVQLLVFIFLTIFPFNSVLFKEKNDLKHNFAYCISLNCLFLIFILLLFSFFKVPLNFIFFVLLFTNFIILLFNFKKLSNYSFIRKNLEFKFFYFFILLFLFIQSVESLEIGWDAFDIWKYIANHFYLENSIFDLNEREGRALMYPHLGSYLWAFFWKNSLLELEYFGRLFYIYCYVTAIFSIILSLKNISIENKILILLFLLFSTYDNNLEGYQEYFIFSFLIIFSITFLNYTEHKSPNFLLIVYIFICTLLPWIKNEGQFYSIFLIISILVNKNLRTKKFYLATLLIMCSIISEFYFRKYIFSPNLIFQSTLSFEKVFSTDLRDYFNKIILISFYVMRECLKYPIWLLNIIILAASLFYFKKSEFLRFIFIFFIINTLFIYSIYILTPIELILHLNTSLDRMMLQTSGLYFVGIIYFINKNKIKIKPNY